MGMFGSEWQELQGSARNRTTYYDTECVIKDRSFDDFFFELKKAMLDCAVDDIIRHRMYLWKMNKIKAEYEYNYEDAMRWIKDMEYPFDVNPDYILRLIDLRFNDLRFTKTKKRREYYKRRCKHDQKIYFSPKGEVKK